MRAIFLAFSLATTGAISFWAGHAYSEYRAAEVMAEIERSSVLTAPEMAVQCAEIVEKRGAQEATSHMRKVARTLFMFNQPSPNVAEMYGHVWLSLPTFGSRPWLDVGRAINDRRETVLREKLATP